MVAPSDTPAEAVKWVHTADGYLHSEIDAARLTEVFRSTVWYVEIETARRRPSAVRSGDRWLFELFSAPDWLAASVRRRSGIDTGFCDAITVTGADVQDNIVPALRLTAGVLLDPGLPHQITLTLANEWEWTT